MITREDTLEIFERFTDDMSLPKFRKEQDEEDDSDVKVSWKRASRSRRHSRIDMDLSEDFMVVSQKVPKSSWSWLRFWDRPPQPSMTILEFFRSLKNSEQEIKVVDERASGYVKLLTTAKRSGQTAFLEQLEDNLTAYRAETQMLAMGITRYIEEKDVVTFYKKCKKGLRLDWIKNFSRVIPDELVAKKVKADELEIFDNYVVLHYDPQGKAYTETKAEVAAKKDPILFGVLRNRRYLYVIGDWQDELCDLTMDKIAEVLGHEPAKTIA